MAATTQSEREELARTLDRKGSFVMMVAGLDKDKVPIPDEVDMGYGKVYIPEEAVTIKQRTRKETVREYVPSVIEPSFGIGRIL